MVKPWGRSHDRTAFPEPNSLHRHQPLVKTQGATDHRGTVRRSKLDPKEKAANPKATDIKRNRGKRHQRRGMIAAQDSMLGRTALPS